MAFLSSTDTSITGQATVDPGLPAGANAAHVLVAFIGPILPSATPAASGWTLIGTQNIGGSSIFAFSAAGDVAGTEFALGGAFDTSCVIAAFSGRNLAAPVEDDAGYSDAQGELEGLPSPSLTVTAGADIARYYTINTAAASTWDGPAAGYTDRETFNLTGYSALLITKDAQAAGATGTVTRGIAGYDGQYQNRVAYAVALAAAGGGDTGEVILINTF